jgi:chorismate dehydratase
VIRLGHIVYSNCFPVHAQLLEADGSPDVEIVRGTPAALNEALALGQIDVAPCSSIEFARHSDRYRILAGLAIASCGPVQSILLESTEPLDRLGGREVAIASASATSAVLLRALLEVRHGVTANLRWFEQDSAEDPLEMGAAAALRIGDIALRRTPPAGRRIIDLGQAWTAWTGLPFVYAVWQTRLADDRDGELLRLRETLLVSLSWFDANLHALADRHAAEFGLRAERLRGYWQALRYRLDDTATAGLLHFYSLAAQLGEAPPVTKLSLLPA